MRRTVVAPSNGTVALRVGAVGAMAKGAMAKGAMAAIVIALAAGCSTTLVSPPAADAPAATNSPATTLPATTLPATDLPATDVPATNLPGTTSPSTTLPAPPTTLPEESRPAESRPAESLPAESLPTESQSLPTIVAPSAANTLPVDLPAPPEAVAPAGHGIGSIEIPRLGLTRYMFEGVELPTLDQGPGHWPGTAMPGETGNVVVAGHRISHNADFAELDELDPGDEVIFNADGSRHVYTVESTEIVEPDALWIVDQTPDATATLFACHPPGSVSQRIVVHLELAD